jgi:toxin ParE1/3/4
MLIKTCNEVASNPQLGKNYDGIAPNLYGFKAGRHLIFYRKLGPEIIEITRILHEQMDLEHRILEK